MRDTKRNIVVLAAISATICGFNARAEETSTTAEKTSNGRTAEDVVNDARAKAWGEWTPPDWRETERRKEELEPPFTRSITFGLGHESAGTVSMDALYDLRAREHAIPTLQYLEPSTETVSDETNGDFTLFVGYAVAPWLDVEFGWSNANMFYQVEDFRAVVDPTLSADAQDMHAEHVSLFEGEYYSLTFLPRWELNEWVAIYGRLGAGYSKGSLKSALSTQGWLSSSRSCDTDGKNCTTSYTYDRRDWTNYSKRDNEVFPMVGVGVEIYQCLRLEYLIRQDYPIGDATTDMSGVYVSIRVKTSWIPRAGQF